MPRGLRRAHDAPLLILSNFCPISVQSCPMAHLPSDLRSLRRKARRRLARIKRDGESRTKREMWTSKITERERAALNVAGISPDSFWDKCRDGNSKFISVRGSEAAFQKALQHRLSEIHGQLNLFTEAGVDPAPTGDEARRVEAMRRSSEDATDVDTRDRFPLPSIHLTDEHALPSRLVHRATRGPTRG